VENRNHLLPEEEFDTEQFLTGRVAPNAALFDAGVAKAE
jgi:hypothetical protein